MTKLEHDEAKLEHDELEHDEGTNSKPKLPSPSIPTFRSPGLIQGQIMFIESKIMERFPREWAFFSFYLIMRKILQMKGVIAEYS